jgi:hypothetical protein
MRPLLTYALLDASTRAQLLLWVNPRSIRYHVGTERPLAEPVLRAMRMARLPGMAWPTKAVARVMSDLHPLVLPPRAFPRPIELDRMPTYRKVRDLMAHWPDFERSIWYQQLLVDIASKGTARHKAARLASERDVVLFFDGYLRDLIGSMVERGYVIERGADVGSAMIAADGEVMKSTTANHRLAIAQAVGVQRFPLVIRCMSAAWLASSGVDWWRPDPDAWTTAVDRIVTTHH